MNTKVLNAQPWRFIPGETVYVRGWPRDETALVTAQMPTRQGFPSYLIVDSVGMEWWVAQLRLSHSPLQDVEA
jgi:hypothetical protein